MTALTPLAAVLLRKFRLRHDRKNAVAIWMAADVASRPSAAFVAVALDPSVLESLDAMTAHALARTAGVYARQLLELACDPEKSSAAAAAVMVSHEVAAWTARHRMFGFAAGSRARTGPAEGPAEGVAGGLAEEGGETGTGGALLREAVTAGRQSFPQFDERTAGVCFRAVAELGAGGLEQVQASEVLALGACRFAAWSVERRLRLATAAEEEEAALVVSAVQLWCSMRRKPAMHVPYTGRRGSPSLQAMSLARDAMTCARLAERWPGIIPGPEARTWSEAAERHGYAGIAMNPDVVMELDLDSAASIAVHATRFANALERSESVVMPLFPAGAMIASPKTVRASLRRLLPSVQGAGARNAA